MAVVGVLGVAAAFALGAGTSRADSGALYVTYNASCNFTIADGSGNTLSSIPSGSYQLIITTPFPFAEGSLAPTTPACDYVQFMLTGPGLGNGLYTDLQGGDQSLEQDTVIFASNSSYTFVDENSPNSTRHTLSVGSPGSLGQANITTNNDPGSSTTPSSTTGGNNGNGNALGTGSTKPPLRGTLIAAVTAAGKLSLSKSGKGVATLKAGRYTIKVTDKSKKTGFNLQETKKAAKALTASKYTGTKSITVTLNAGQWFFYGAFVGKKTFFFVTS
jgi:hypothetical protein